MTEKINIAISFDEGYAEQATVMLYSLLANNARNNLVVYAFYSDLSKQTKDRILSNLSGFANVSLHWILFDKSLIGKFEIRKGHVNEYTYTRIFIPEVLQDLDRILYLDCDMVVLGDVLELWQTDLGTMTLAAVEDLSSFDRHAELMMPLGAKYFNAGVLLINAAKWRAGGYSERVTKRLIELGGKAAWWDQDGLNSILNAEWVQVAQKWNIQSHDVFLAQEKRIKKVKDYLKPAIVHFTGNLKPWNYKSSNPFKKDYYAYLNATDYKKNHRPQNKTTVNVMRRMVRNLFVELRLVKY